jgi:hypothetical protein
MKISRALGLVALCVYFLSAHALGQKLYPVQGPLAAETNQQVFAGKIRRPMFSAGPPFLLLKSWTLANGEELTGKAKTVAAASAVVSPREGAKIDLPQANLAFAWDIVFGEGFYVSKVLGKKFGQGVFTSAQGTVLQVESLTGTTGVAVDNKGNIYKMAW